MGRKKRSRRGVSDTVVGETWEALNFENEDIVFRR